MAQVAPPGRVSFQGVAKDTAGNLLSGPVTMNFRFYDADSAGVLLWEEIYDPSVYPPQVTVSAGLFGVALGDPAHRHGGSETAFQGVFANHGAVYLGVSVATDPEMTPRIQVASSPFALNSDALSGKHSADFANASHTHSGSDVTSVVADATHAASADTATTRPTRPMPRPPTAPPPPPTQPMLQTPRMRPTPRILWTASMRPIS